MRVWLLSLALFTACGPKTPDTLAPTATPPKVSSMADYSMFLDVDSLWDFQDPSATRAAFERRRVEIESRLAKADLPDGAVRRLELARLELLTQMGRTYTLEGTVAEADVLLARVTDELGAEPAADTVQVQVRWLLEHGRARRTEKKPDDARVAFVQAWELARTHSPALDGFAVDAAHMVAIVDSGTPGELEWGEKALALAESSPDARAQKWRASLLNNLGWGAFDRGEYEQALALMARQVALRRESGTEPALRIALWSHARVLRALGRVDEALAAQQALLADYGDDAKADGFVHEEMAECLLALGRDADAKAWFASAHALLGSTWLADAEPERLARLAELGGVATP